MFRNKDMTALTYARVNLLAAQQEYAVKLNIDALQGLTSTATDWQHPGGGPPGCPQAVKRHEAVVGPPPGPEPRCGKHPRTEAQLSAARAELLKQPRDETSLHFKKQKLNDICRMIVCRGTVTALKVYLEHNNETVVYLN
jgi:hypothetical protein